MGINYIECVGNRSTCPFIQMHTLCSVPCKVCKANESNGPVTERCVKSKGPRLFNGKFYEVTDKS